jgi:hypothetical protein
MRVLGDNLFAMDEAPARKSESGGDAPTFGDLSKVLDEAQTAIDAMREVLRSGRDAKDGAFNFDRVKRRAADVCDCMDELKKHLGGGSAEDDEPGGSEGERDAAFRRARDGQVDHRRDLDPAKAADARRGMALDADLDLDEIFRRAQGDGADVASLHEIFAPTAP